MNSYSQNNPIMLGPGLRNICDKLIFELNNAVFKLIENRREPNDKIKEFRNLIKQNFHPYIIKIRKVTKYLEKFQNDSKAIGTLDRFYASFENIYKQLDFILKLSDLYIFPKFDLNDALDLIFTGSTNNLRQEIVKANLFNLILSKNLEDNNDIGFLINNDLNNEDFNNSENNNNNNILLDKENIITKNIVERLKTKLEEFNEYISENKEGFNENNFKLYLDKYICVKLFNNFIIKFILVQQKLDTNKYCILPIEISYNNEKINLNDKEEIFKDKNKILSKKDLHYFIDKFKSKSKIRKKKAKKPEIQLEIEKFSKEDFIEKCLLFKEYIKSLFMEKFEDLKKDIIDFIKNYDLPIDYNINMEIENNENSDIIELPLYFNFSVKMKNSHEFYVKLIYNKNYPTIIKIIYLLGHNLNKNNAHEIPLIFIEPTEQIFLFTKKDIKICIQNCFENYKYILINWIYKKLRYLYPIFFDFYFKLHNQCFSIILYISSKKIFSLYINDSGKLSFKNLYSTKLFYDDFKELNSIIVNFLKNIESDELIMQFNNYMSKIIIEKMFIFPGTKSKLIELNDESRVINFYLYNSYYSDNTISVYFDVKGKLFKMQGKNNNYMNYFNINEINLICSKNKEPNKKIVLDCLDRENPNLMKIIQKVDLNEYYYLILKKLVNEFNNKYELFMLYASEIILLSDKPKSIFELNKSMIIDNINNHKRKEDEWYQISIQNNNMNFFKDEYKKKLIKYFYKIKFSKENNVFQFYLKDDAFRGKFSPIKNYSLMSNQFYILGYDYDEINKEDFITIIILSKMKIGYQNIIQLIFETFLPKIMSYMDNILKLMHYLSENDNPPEMIACPLLLTVFIKYIDLQKQISFKNHINIKFTDKEPFFSAEGNFNSIFMSFVKDFGNDLINTNYDYNNKTFFMKKSKYFYLSYGIYELFLNEFEFKFSLLNYPYNHFKQNSSHIYFLNKDFNVLELISLKKLILTVQITNNNDLYIEFIDNSSSDNNGGNIGNFIGLLRQLHFNLNLETKENINNKFSISIDDDNENKSISLIEKLKYIVQIFINFSK